MKVELKKCNNIESGVIEIKERTLNIKYAINGTGKSTIAKAIVADVIARTKGDKSFLGGLTPFKYSLLQEGNFPDVRGTETINTVKVFDERYINDFVFQPDELLKGSFDVFIRDAAYENGMKEIDALVEAMQKALSEDKDIADLVADFTEISGSFGKQTKSGIHGSSGLAKAFKGGNKVSNIPEGLEAYKSYIQHSDNYKWLRWQLDGRNFSDISHDCPFCTNDIKEKKETIKRVGEVYEPKAVENLNKIVSAFRRLNKYFSDETRQQIEEFVTNVNGYSDDQVAFLKEIKDQIDRLNHKFINAQRLGFSSLKDVEKVIVGLRDHRIDLGLFVHLRSESTQIKADIVNHSIDRLLEQAGVLQGSINRQKILIERLVKENSKNINEFLKNAGYQYSVCLTEEGNGQHKLKLTHNDIGQEISNAKGHLSFGERNAFALVLFMFDVIKTVPDLIVLDDPISSFDKNKKYAIVEMLFRKENSLRNKTVLMLTHDFEPIVDMVMHHSDRFQKPFAAFLENKNGVLKEKQILKSDIKTFVEIIDANLSIEIPHINKLTYLRRRSEISGKRDMAYHLISGNPGSGLALTHDRTWGGRE